MASSRSRYRQPPDGCYRRRLCLECKVDLMADGYLLNSEDAFPQRGTCERCGKRKVLSAVFRYTLSAKERERRGLP